MHRIQCECRDAGHRDQRVSADPLGPTKRFVTPLAGFEELRGREGLSGGTQARCSLARWPGCATTTLPIGQLRGQGCSLNDAWHREHNEGRDETASCLVLHWFKLDASANACCTSARCASKLLFAAITSKSARTVDNSSALAL